MTTAVPLTDIHGRTVTINAGPYVFALGTRPYSITRQTRRGQVQWVATWHPTWNQATFAGKRDATRFIKAHEAEYYTGPRRSACVISGPHAAHGNDAQRCPGAPFFAQPE